MKKPKGEYAIQTVVNAMRLLEAFRDEEELGVTELSRRLSLHKNNVFRLLATLEQQGYIEQSTASDRYRLGVESLELGQAFLRGRTLLPMHHVLWKDFSGGEQATLDPQLLVDTYQRLGGTGAVTLLDVGEGVML
jgi:DNA-binding MarR family transcriptional regulator